MTNLNIHSKIETLELGIRNILKWVTIAVVLLMVALINIQIFFRYILGSALPWPEGTAVLLNIWLTYIGGTIAYYEGDHVSVGYFHQKTSDKTGKAIKIFINFIILILAGSMVYYGSKLAISQASGETLYLHISLFWTRVPLAIGGLYLIIEASRRISENIKDITGVSENIKDISEGGM